MAYGNPYGSVRGVATRPTTGAGTLTRDDWAAAALGALRTGGPRTVAVEPLARSLGTTKGSFYWHFAARAELLEAALARWEAQETDAVMVVADEAGEPRERLLRLFELVVRHAGHHLGEVALFAEAEDPVVREAVARVAGRRIAYVEGLLRTAGLNEHEAGRRAHLLFTVVLGLDLLGAALPDRLPATDAERAAWTTSLVDMALS